MITTYQIRNVLRTYGNQLKKRTKLLQESPAHASKPPDIIDISSEARRKQMLNQVSNIFVSNITQDNILLNSDGKAENYEN